MVTGRVIRFDEVRGYGFISPDNGGYGEDVFLHVNMIDGGSHQLAVGTPVEFKVREGERGLKAYQVRVLDEGGGSGHTPVDTASLARGGTAESESDGMCDVLTQSEFVGEVTEVLIRAVPNLTCAQLAVIRESVAAVAKKYGWIDTVDT